MRESCMAFLTTMQSLSAARIGSPAPDVVTGILREAEGYNLVILGATREGLFDQLLFGAIPRRVAEECPKTVIMVNRY